MSLPIGAPLMLEVSEPFSASAMEVTITAGVQVHFEFFLGSDRIGVEKIETSAAESNSTPRVVVQGLPSLRGLPFNRVAVTSESERTSPIKIGHLHFR